MIYCWSQASLCIPAILDRPGLGSPVLRVEFTEGRDVGVRETPVLGNVLSDLKLVPISQKVVEHIAAVAEKKT